MDFKQIAPYIDALHNHNHLQAWIIEMLYRDGMSFAEIAQRVKLSPDQVRAEEVLAIRKLMLIAIAGRPGLSDIKDQTNQQPSNKARLAGSKHHRDAGPSKARA